MTGRRQPPVNALRQRPVELQTPTETTTPFDSIAGARALRMISQLEQEPESVSRQQADCGKSLM